MLAARDRQRTASCWRLRKSLWQNCSRHRPWRRRSTSWMSMWRAVLPGSLPMPTSSSTRCGHGLSSTFSSTHYTLLYHAVSPAALQTHLTLTFTLRLSLTNTFSYSRNHTDGGNTHTHTHTLAHSFILSPTRHRLVYQEDMPVEQLVTRLCDIKQGYTQYGGLRPFGVSLLYVADRSLYT